MSRVVPEFAPGPTASGAPEYFATGTPEDPQLVVTGQGADQAVVVLPLTPASLDWAAPTARRTRPARCTAPRPAARRARRGGPGRTAAGPPGRDPHHRQRALAAARGEWDLAQFDLASSGRTRALRKAGSAASQLARAPQWRAARWALGVIVVTQVAGLNVWAWQERQALAAKEAGVRNALTQTFPQVKAVVDAPVQMERELVQLRQAAGSMGPSDLEPLMAATGAALSPGQIPATLEYGTGELRLRGLDLPPEEIDALNQRLLARGYVASDQNNQLQIRAEASR